MILIDFLIRIGNNFHPPKFCGRRSGVEAALILAVRDAWGEAKAIAAVEQASKDSRTASQPRR
jgi:hypothetical protein